jgi:hypothetical protein
VGVLKDSAGGSKEKDGWDLVFMVQPFRRGDGTIVESEAMRVEAGPITEKALSTWMARLSPGDLVRFAAREVSPPPRGLPWWHGRASLPIRKARDAELEAIAARRATPVVVTDPTLGTLTLIREHDCWKTRRRRRGSSYGVFIDRSHQGDDRRRDARDIVRAGRVVRRIEEDLGAIRRAVVEAMLPLHNDTWRGDAPRLSARRFAARLSISEMSVAPGGAATLWFEADGMFTDHAIEVRLGRTGKVKEIGLAG